jgi:Uma2 family endonuclease
MTEPLPLPRMTVEEYLQFEAAAPTKHEYVAGEVYAMSGVTRRHARIVMNITGRLWGAARGGPCEVISVDVKLRAATDRIYYPDVMVLCTPGPDEDVVLHDPCLLVEVTSPSTARTDRSEKLGAYQGVPSLRAYLIVDHRRRRVERHWRDAAGAWQRDEIVGEGRVPVPCPATELALDDIYEGVHLAIVGEPEPWAYADDALEGEPDPDEVYEA